MGKTKMKRYWPGKAPEWADRTLNGEDKALSCQGSSAIIARKDEDARLHRLAKRRVHNREQVRVDHRLIRQAEIISATIQEENPRLEFEDDDDDDEDALEERRRRIREKNLQGQQEEEALPEEEEEEVEESEYETESDEETTGILAVVKHVFVLKSDRDTIDERDRREAKERALEQLVKNKLEERKLETKQILAEKIREEEIVQKNLELEADIVDADVDTDDEVNEVEEYEDWKYRETARNKRKRNEMEEDKETDEEETKRAKRKKWKFMQKYYHKGAFFQSDPDDRARTAGADSIYHRDFSATTGEDKLDKSILPKVMQVKHFGRCGRTKWTHLVNEDTTFYVTCSSFVQSI